MVDGGVGYIGIKPKNGNATLAFSVFGSGTSVVDKSLCCVGADDNAGVSCSAQLNKFELSKRYYLNVYRDSNDRSVWYGLLTNSSDNETLNLGAWKQLTSVKGISNNNTGFVEYYNKLLACSEPGKIDVDFYQPRVERYSTVITGPSEYGRCKANMRFSDKNTGNWMASVTAGYK